MNEVTLTQADTRILRAIKDRASNGVWHGHKSDIAEALGYAVSTLTKTLRKLRKAGCIASFPHSRNGIEIRLLGEKAV